MKDIITDRKTEITIIPHPCEHKDNRIPIDTKLAKQHAQITDICSSYPIMKELKEYTGWIQFGYDPKNHSLDIFFKRAGMEWDWGAGIQINKLTVEDKEALKKYLERGK